MTIFWTFGFNGTTSAQVLKTVPVLQNLQSRATGIAVLKLRVEKIMFI